MYKQLAKKFDGDGGVVIAELYVGGYCHEGEPRLVLHKPTHVEGTVMPVCRGMQHVHDAVCLKHCPPHS